MTDRPDQLTDSLRDVVDLGQFQHDFISRLTHLNLKPGDDVTHLADEVGVEIAASLKGAPNHLGRPPGRRQCRRGSSRADSGAATSRYGRRARSDHRLHTNPRPQILSRIRFLVVPNRHYAITLDRGPTVTHVRSSKR